MNIAVFFTLSLLIVTSSPTVYAATLIESKESKAGLQKTWIDGDKLRAETESGDQYMIMNFTQRTMHIVHPGRMQVLDMSKVIESHPEDKNRNTEMYTVEKKGTGPTVAGYKTDHYVVLYEGKRCFESFTSKQAVKDMELERYISGMDEMFPRENSPETDNNPCVNAENVLDYTKIGIPLKLIEQNGDEVYSITKFEKNGTVPYGGFSIPDGFTIIDYGQMVQQMTQPAQN